MRRVKFFPGAEGSLLQGFNKQCVANVDPVDAKGMVLNYSSVEFWEERAELWEQGTKLSTKTWGLLIIVWAAPSQTWLEFGRSQKMVWSGSFRCLAQPSLG